MTALETSFAVQTKMYKCDGCPARAKVRLQVWSSWEHHLDFCRHHAQVAINKHPEAIIIEERD